MQLDFSAIRGTTETAPDSSTAAPSERHTRTEPSRSQNDTGKAKAGVLLSFFEREQVDHERLLAAYSEIQRNIKRAGELRADILRGARSGEEPVRLLLKAVKCISLMTGESLFYSQIEGDLKSIYGAGLLDPKVLELDLLGTQKRLQKLQNALERETETADSKKRIQAAIDAHKDKIRQLQEQINA